MKELPAPEDYEKEFKYFPWGKLIDRVLSFILERAGKDAKVLDLMCGPGYLLHLIQEKRPDLELVGIDIDKRFINYAEEKYKGVEFIEKDVLKWKLDKKFNIIVCTGGIHHLSYEKQESFIKKTSMLLADKGICIFADPYLDDYDNEKERKIAAIKLGCEYAIASVKLGAPKEIQKATIDIIYNDVLGYEYKTSLKKLLPVFEKYFSRIEVHKTWPSTKSEYGDYYFIAYK